MVNKHDILFLLNRTGLNIHQLVLLIEEERDYHLLLEAISQDISPSDKKYFKYLSDKLRVKLAIYYNSKHKQFDICEKLFVSNIVSDNYDFLYKKGRSIKNNQKKEIKYFLSVLKDAPKNYNEINKYKEYFNSIGQKELINHVNDWSEIFSNTKTLVLV